MKKPLRIVFSVIMICVATVAQAQDSTSSDHSNQKGKAKEIEGAAMKEPGVREGIISTEDQAQEGGRPTQEQTDQATTPEQNSQSTNQRGESTLINDKMGPKGEPVFINNGAYYYLSDAGEKVKIEKSALKDKTQ